MLGVTIPTYKRPEQLKLCLESVIKAGRDFKVPIYVLDDSCDGTNQAVMATATDVYPWVYHIKNEGNLGIDRNICKSVDACETEYVWLMGEDDRIMPDGISAVLKLINAQSTHAPFIYVNYAAVDCTIRTILRTQAIPFVSDKSVPFEDFASTYSWAAGFIGGCVIRKEDWGRVRTERYMDTYFAHVGHILEMIVDQDVPMIAKSYVLNRCGEPRLFTWTSDFFDVLKGWSRMTALLPDPPYHADLRNRCVDSFETSQGMRTIKFLLYARADYAYNREMFNRYILPQSPRGAYRFGAQAVLWVPPVLIRIGRSVLALLRTLCLPAVDRCLVDG